MKTIAFFNNKGGVGKTTLTCNIAANLAKEKNVRVLVIDADPQCNTTQLILPESVWGPLYAEGHGDGRKSTTLMDFLSPLEEGDADPLLNADPISGAENRFGVDLIAGHPRLSLIEDILSAAWKDASSGDLGGLRRTKWLYHVTRHFADRYDYAFIDVGPSLGALNRSILLECDNFVTPMAADIFSILGVRNIRQWIDKWLSTYSTGRRLAEENVPGVFARYFDDEGVRIREGFAGYTVQQYITKSKEGVRRPTAAFENILNDLPGEITESLGKYRDPKIDEDGLHLGDVPSMYSLVPLAQSRNCPISELRSADGLAGGQYKQQEQYVSVIDGVASTLTANLEAGGDE
ncbi:ParA family protein [Brachybacterium alimentarium]|uniref:ParA family protein n=1 Tax=Brachybacterium alimentarium TaxID=47845 RepID=UPI003FD43C0F